MNKNKIEFLKRRLNIKKDSKLSGYFDDDSQFVTEVKNLNNLSVSFFILAMLDKLIQENYFNKETIIDMINEIL